MSELAHQISKELSLWKPQKIALRAFSSKLDSFDLKHDDISTIEGITGLKFDTKYPSFTFDMATGSGKTRLMGACLYYLHKKNISKNFFVLAPGETIYKKLINDFTKEHQKFLLQGWSEMPNFEVVTGENYERFDPSQMKLQDDKFTVFIFNIDKFRRREKKQLKFHRFRETLGASFGEILSNLSDLVLLMDESHHYRAELTKEVIEDLKPILGLEFSATPEYTKNIVYSYSLGDAVNDYIVKRLEAVVRKDDRSFSEELDELKLREGLKIHEKKKIWIEEFCENNEILPIKPVAFVSTKDIRHGTEIQNLLESDKFEKGKYKGKTLYVHSGSEDQQIEELLHLEEPNNKKEIVIHVNKLKEGWDVKNIFTIIPLRASISKTLTEQTIGRGVRLPFLDATKEQIDNYPNAFTLHIITFAAKDDNYKDIVGQSKKNNITIKNYDDEDFTQSNLEKYEILPINKKQKISIPIFESTIEYSGKLDVFNIEPEFEKLRSDVHPKLEAVSLADGSTEEIGKAIETTITLPIQYLINKLIEETDEIDAKDKDVVVKIVKSYLKKATGSNNEKDWEKLLNKHRRTIFIDISDKITYEVQNSVKVSHKFKKTGEVSFDSYIVSKAIDSPIVDKTDMSNESTKNVFRGYERCIYSEMKFDSKQEKWLADILDKDMEVKRWLKNPVAKSGVGIKYKFGNYYPDFFAETKDVTYVIEVKGRDKLEDEAVLEKAKEGIAWCNEISKISKTKWKYGLLPHDKFGRGESFKMVSSSFAVV